MKLYLSSYRIPDLQVLSELVGKPAAKTKVGLIPNAKDYYAFRARRVKIRLVESYLRTFGFHVGVVDLAERYSRAALRDTLKKYDMLWVMGGNTFCLREAMRRSGFDKVVHQVVEDGVVFAGESAGACIAGTDLHGVERLDDVAYAGRILWDGLSLSAHDFLPHADNDGYGSDVQALLAERAGDERVVALNDNQAWIRNGDDEWKITGVKQEMTE
ncbi:MAG TPA: Type 1 glutamine amidotransferase-like domain-containing protein [Candidatus Saccharimonadales bacterium]|nr:Type 1 glutamine amidotransferase-like domain-containing protein [Candidatus Saccharimonadales bacterium]